VTPGLTTTSAVELEPAVELIEWTKDSMSAVAGTRINYVVQWVRSRFNEVIEKAEFVQPPGSSQVPGRTSVSLL
jgi:hypothetical protein